MGKINTIITDVHSLLYWIKKNAFYIGINKKCPVCNHRIRKFAPLGIKKRENSRCIWCGSLPRHRLIWLFFERKTNLFIDAPNNMLHIAPEKAFTTKLKKILGEGYITADLYNDAMIKMDITDIQFPNNYFSVIYCSHVLEHVLDDKKAIREMSRVLKKEGWALIVVPITSDITFEDKNIIDPKERFRVFGQEDHVRRCGLDYKERLENNGFNVKVYKVDDVVNLHEQVIYGIKKCTLFYCTKKVLRQ
jgi:predicted SAM-dependent methyltransferase